MRFNASQGVTLAIALLLASCTPHEVMVNGVKKETGTQVNAFGGGYQAVCSASPSVDNFATELNRVQPAATPVGGTLQVHQAPRRPVGSIACLDTMHEAQAEAIRRAKLFDTVRVLVGAKRDERPPLQGADYDMWNEGDEMVVAYKGGPRFPLNNGPGSLDQWVKTVDQTFKTAKDWAESSSDIMQAHIVGPHIYYVLDGKEYTAAIDVESAVNARSNVLLQNLRPAAPVGGNAHIYLASHQAQAKSVEIIATSHNTEIAVAGPSFLNVIARNGVMDHGPDMNASDALLAYVSGFAQLKADALKRSGLFDSVSVETSDLANPPLAGKDIVIWQRPDNPAAWMLRIGLGPTEVLTWPTLSNHHPVNIAALWVEAVRAAVLKAQAAPGLDNADLLEPGCVLPEYSQSAAKSGSVTAAFDLDPRGAVTNSRVVTSSGNVGWDNTMRQAFAQCRFKAGMRNHEAVASSVTLTYGAQPGEPLNPGVPASTVQPANGPAGPVSIKIGDVTYPTLDDAFAAQQASAEKAVAGVAALHAPTHGSLLIAIPVPEEPKTPPPINGMAPETIKALLVYSVKTSKIANEATAEAIRNSTIFSSVTIINANTVSDDFQGNDYLMKLASASAGKPYGWQLTRRQGGESRVTPVQVAPTLTTGNLIDLVKRLDSAASSLEKP